jgi:chemotaxis protein CheD
MNGEFAEKFLRHEGIAYAGGSLGGERGRRVQFWPTSGRARQVALRKNEIFSSPRGNVPFNVMGRGDVELF